MAVSVAGRMWAGELRLTADGCRYDVPTETELKTLRENGWMFWPDSRFKMLWDWALLATVLYVAIETPYEFAFLNQGNVGPVASC